MTESHKALAALSMIILMAAIIRLLIIPRQSLWSDEIFSIATATGHSLEQPADESQPSLGDYIETSNPQLPGFYRAYMSMGPASNLQSVVRAVFLSDTNPPLYYLLLRTWMLPMGTSDYSLRIFSTIFSLACVPLIFLVGCRVEGPTTGLIAALLFAFAPTAVFYSTEGRMYSMVWLQIVGYVYLLLRLYQDGAHWGAVSLAILVGTAGLLTHYFFLFPWLATTLWLLIVGPDKTRRMMALLVPTISGLIVSAWYINLPVLLNEWRITKNWQAMPPSGWARMMARFPVVWLLTPIYTMKSFVSLRGNWTSMESLIPIVPLDLIVLGFAVLVFSVAFYERRFSLFTGKRGFLWVWLISACSGPVCFDLLQHTYTSTISRYAIAGLPAMFLLLAISLASLPRTTRNCLAAAMLLFWAIGDGRIYYSASRDGEPFKIIAQTIEAESPPSDLLVIHSVPVGILGLARYLNTSSLIFSWVGQLRQRSVPGDISRVVANSHTVILLKVHDIHEPAPEEKWLADHEILRRSETVENSTLDFFEVSNRFVKPNLPGHRFADRFPVSN
jgi:uncharacterized membrane protein